MSQLQKLIQELKSQADPQQAISLQRFFKTSPGQYASGDVFLGIRVPQLRIITQKYLDLSLKNLTTLLASKIHELRFSALLILIEHYQSVPNLVAKKQIVNFYLQQASHINNWDLVDLSVTKILGDFLVRREKIKQKNKKQELNLLKSQKSESSFQVLDKLASSANLWERRIAIVATQAFIKNGSEKLSFKIAEKLLKDSEDLIQKATGWTLREVGKNVGEDKLLKFLDQHHQTMSRITLRYSLERLSPTQRASCLSWK